MLVELRANIDWKAQFQNGVGHFGRKLRQKGTSPPTICVRIVMPYNFAADSFHTNKLCSTLSSSEVHFLYGKRKIVAFEAPFGGLGATYAIHLRLIGKLLVDFLLVITELFFARCFRFVTTHAFDRQTDGLTALRSPIPRCIQYSAVKIG